MSNIGKTFWSKKLVDISFIHENCDENIEELLSPILIDLGFSGIEDVSRWMGQPYDENFPAHQMKYLSLEKAVLGRILQKVKTESTENTVIDTTGSIIHTSKELCEKLNCLSVVVYLETSEDMKEEMFQKYLEEPKPVVFGDIYSPRENEDQIEALGRSYKDLLDLRSSLYKSYADIIIPYEKNDYEMSAEDFISLIKDYHEVL